MGKSKRRIFNNKCNDKQGNVLKRSEVIKGIISEIKSNNVTSDTKKLVALFGITAEELSEAGASYEELCAAVHLIF